MDNGTGDADVELPLHTVLYVNTAPEWCSGLKAQRLSARGITTDTLVRIQAVSQPDVIGSPVGRRTIGPASYGFGLV